jgi:hypothetical protein
MTQLSGAAGDAAVDAGATRGATAEAGRRSAGVYATEAVAILGAPAALAAVPLALDGGRSEAWSTISTSTSAKNGATTIKSKIQHSHVKAELASA